MDITEIKNNDTEFHVRVTIPVKEVNSKVEQELANMARTAKIDGFRIGKVPVSFLKKKYGASIRADVVKNKVVKAINEIKNNKNLRVLLDPEIDNITNEESKDLAFTLKYQLLPEITIPEFKKISIEKPILELKDKDIDEQLESLRLSVKEYSKVSKSKAKEGDQLTIDAVGYINDKAFAGGKLDSYKLVLGSKAFIAGFEDQLIGTNTGDEVSVKVNFPEEYHEKTLAGKPAEFKVKVLAIHSESEAKLDDEFAKKFNLANLEELRKEITKSIRKNFEEPIESLMKMELFNKLEKILNFSVPQVLIDREINILERQIAATNDEEFNAKSEEDKRSYLKNLASRRVKLGLMLAEYVKLKQINIGKEDIYKALTDHAKNFPGQENQIIDFYLKNSEALESLKGPVLEDKAVRVIFEQEVKLIEKSYSKAKLEKLLEKDSDSYLYGHHMHEYDDTPRVHAHSSLEHTHDDHVHDENCKHDYDQDGYVRTHKDIHISNSEISHDHTHEHNDRKDQKKAKPKKQGE